MEKQNLLPSEAKEVLQFVEVIPSKKSKRSVHWKKFAAYVKHIHQPFCAYCNESEPKNLEVHHITPFWKDKSEELNLNNVITLCQIHHKEIGHHNNKRLINTNVIEDCINNNPRFKKWYDDEKEYLVKFATMKKKSLNL